MWSSFLFVSEIDKGEFELPLSYTLVHDPKVTIIDIDVINVLWMLSAVQDLFKAYCSETITDTEIYLVSIRGTNNKWIWVGLLQMFRNDKTTNYVYWNLLHIISYDMAIMYSKI